MNRFLEAIKSFFQPLSPAQKVLFGILSVGLVGGFLLVLSWAMKPNYSILFGSLSPDSAQSIVTELQKSGTPYKLENNGTAIMVPRDKVYALRLKFAAEGDANSSDNKGFELFDNNTLGMTDFMQKVDYNRALEGELARTINSLDEVESSRIHLVMADRSPFAQNTIQPTAAVFLKLKPGRTLKKNQINGIASLIAGSVPGLSPEKVVILDQKGNRISDDALSNSKYASTNLQMKIQKDMEAYLTQKGQSMLDQVLGPGNSILRVSTEHNFDRIVKESNLIDPDSRTIISQEKRTNKNNNQSSQPISISPGNTKKVNSVTTASKADQTTIQVTNYDVDKTNEKLEKPIGEVTRISASVLLNYEKVDQTDKNGKKSVIYQPHSKEELAQIKDVMIGALGINPKRGDQITITQMKFENPDDFVGGQSGFEPTSKIDIFRWILVALSVIVAGIVVFGLTRKFNPDKTPFLVQTNISTLPQADAGHTLSEPQTEKPGDIYKNKLSDEARKQLEAKNDMSLEIKSFISDNTSQMSNVIHSLLAEDKN